MAVNIIAPRTGVAFALNKGQTLKVIDPKGEQVSDLLAFRASDAREVISPGRTLDYVGRLYLTAGDAIYSNRSNILLRILTDTVGRHDFLLTPCSKDTFRIIYGDAAPHRGCFGNFEEALAPYGIGADDIPVAFNVFMNVTIDARTSELKVQPPLSKAGDHVVFQAEEDLIVALTACSALQSNNYAFKAIHYEIADPGILAVSAPVKEPERPKLLEIMGPGLITGASDDDPSGIATYSQVGAQFGSGLGWLLFFSYPLMVAIQEISARIGRVTGLGIAGNLRKHYPRWVLHTIVTLLVVANTINIGADLGAMGAALKLLIGGPAALYIVGFAAVSVLLEVFVRYSRYVSVLKWLSLSLLAYVATVFVVKVPWGEVASAVVFPPLSLHKDYVVAVVAVLGTTISPYLFFWQAEEEVEQQEETPKSEPLVKAPEQAKAAFFRIRADTMIGMAISNAVAFFIILTTAATLHAHGTTDIQTSAQAAEALKPIAGRFAFVLFSVGIIGTGLLALPVLAGSAAYALGEAQGWRVGLAKPAGRAKAFYGTIAAATVVGALLNFTRLDPIKALFWSAVVNGVVAVPVMAMMMLLTARRIVMGEFKLPIVLRALGWIATGVMAAVVIAMAFTLA